MSDELNVVRELNEAAENNMIVCENLVKIYKTHDIEVVALQGLDLTVARGELMAIIGNSGSGKSTLLNMLGGLDKPSAGSLTVDGKNLLKFTDHDMISYKRDTVGFVWQNNARNLIPYLSAVENIELPMIISSRRKKRARALELLEQVGLSNRKNSKLAQLSGGEQQRIAIAIALANSPKLLLADEPTGAVDTKTAAHILELFRKLNRDTGITIVIVTHDRMISKHVDRVVAIRDGRTSSEFLIRSDYAKRIGEIDSLSRSEDNETHDEYAVMDKTGRLQIPRDYLDTLGLTGKNKVRVELEDGRIVLTPPKLDEEQHEAPDA